MVDALHFRPLTPRDSAQLRAAHRELFPIDYEDWYFRSACHGTSQVFTVAAFSGNNEELVAFAIGRCFQLGKMHLVERHNLGILDTVWDPLYGSYVLTIGVVKKWQRQGIAKRIMTHFEDEAKRRASQLIFLHVITYNSAAIQLYESTGYVCMTRLHNFYHIRTGRQLEPSKAKWDAFLFLKFSIHEEEIQAMQKRKHSLRSCLGWNLSWALHAKYLIQGAHLLERDSVGRCWQIGGKKWRDLGRHLALLVPPPFV